MIKRLANPCLRAIFLSVMIFAVIVPRIFAQDTPVTNIMIQPIPGLTQETSVHQQMTPRQTEIYQKLSPAQKLEFRAEAVQETRPDPRALAKEKRAEAKAKGCVYPFASSHSSW